MTKARYFKLEQYNLCSNETDLVELGNFTVTFIDNVFKISCIMNVKQDLREHLQVSLFFKNHLLVFLTLAPFQLEVTVDRCQINRAQCESFEQLVVKDLCEKLFVSSVSVDFVDKITPPLRCPIKVGSYLLNEGKLDLNLIAHLPLDGFRWAVSVKIWDVSDRPKKTLISCVEGQVRVMLNSRRRMKIL